MKVLLHIGDQKTGSKSLQQVLCLNSERWRDFGITSPSVTKLNVWDAGLFAFAYDPSTRSLAESMPEQHALWVDRYRRSRGLSSYAELDSFLRTELAVQLEHMNTAIFSFENLLWLKPESIATLRKRLSEFFDEFELVVFLRRQDRKAVSLYSTRLVSGAGETRLLPRNRGVFEYYNAVTRWREFFRPDALTIHIYEDEPDTRAAFVKKHLPCDLPVEFGDRLHRALDGKTQEVLHALQAQFGDSLPAASEAHALRRAIVNTVKGGCRALPLEHEARAFLNGFREGNERLCREFTPERENLFDEDFSEYNQPREQNVFTAEDMANLALSLWSVASARSR